MLKQLTALGDYLQGGAMHAIGANPMGIAVGGRPMYEFGNVAVTWNKFGSTKNPKLAMLAGMGTMGLGGAVMSMFSDTMGVSDGIAGGMALGAGAASLFGPGMFDQAKARGPWTKWGGTALGMGMGAYFMYEGYQENGLAGARDAMVWDLATNAALARFGYTRKAPEVALGAVGGTKHMKNLVKFGFRGIGASMGASAGQALLGPLGTFAGAYVGAAPIAFISKNPAIAVGAIAAGTIAAAGYGMSHVVKQGYAHAQMKKGLQSSGSTAAFMTSGATTMRARAVAALSKSHMNARSALGREAAYLSQPQRNYFSNYR